MSQGAVRLLTLARLTRPAPSATPPAPTLPPALQVDVTNGYISVNEALQVFGPEMQASGTTLPTARARQAHVRIASHAPPESAGGSQEEVLRPLPPPPFPPPPLPSIPPPFPLCSTRAGHPHAALRATS